jgi:3-deoxy-7-phosphoheptulonate synthase
VPRRGARAPHRRVLEFAAGWPGADRHRDLLGDLAAVSRFLGALGDTARELRSDDLYTSHEALLLPYEAALTRFDRRSRRHYDTSAHLLWIGERTRQPDGAHVEFASGVGNPVAVKIGPAATADEVLALVDRLDPDREPGRLALVLRLGADRVEDVLPGLVARVTAEGAAVAWLCDPMHGNTVTAPSGHKTRRFDDVLREVRGFVEVHRALGTHPGGLHLELTARPVTECVGGHGGADLAGVPARYESACDPRLNHDQSLSLAIAVGSILRDTSTPAREDLGCASSKISARGTHTSSVA